MKSNILLNQLDKFFFYPRATEGMGLFRILWGLLLLLYFIVDLGNVQDFYGPHAIISLQTAKDQFPGIHLNVFHLLNQGYQTVYFLLIVHGLALVSMILGFYTRTSICVVLICMVSFQQRNIWLLSSLELLMRTITILLLCSPCGHSLSLDSWLGKRYVSFKKEKQWAPWALRLIQIQISVIYIWTVWQKLKGSDWIDGTAVYYATRLEGMTNFPVPYLLDSPFFLALATWGTLAIEFCLGVLVWFKKTRRSMIIIGLLFHLGIEYVMSVPFFEVLMMALLTLFYTPEELKAFAHHGIKQILDFPKLLKIKMEGGQNEAA